MNNYKRLNEIVKESRNGLNSLYDDFENPYIKRGLEICGFKDKKAHIIAVLRRIVDLKVDPMMQEFTKLGYSKEKSIRLRDQMYDYTRMIHEDLHRNLINRIQSENLLDKFHFALVVGIHKIGLIIDELQKEWQNQIIDTTNERFKTKFSSISEAKKFIHEHGLYQMTSHGDICDRSYGVVVCEDNVYKMVPYAVAFRSQIIRIERAFDDLIEKLNYLSHSRENSAYITYLEKLKLAFTQSNNHEVISSWRDAEMAWMDIKTPIQIGHPLEYYEDAYTHAVALEWDIRLEDSSDFNSDEFKSNITDSFERIYKKIGSDNVIMRSFVKSNINKTQLYISTPMIYYGADLNGLFSAQVVPNDEFVSMNCGKKIFAFVNFVYENAKSKPFMKLSSEIFDLEYLNFGREILFKKPEIWRKIYEISTIGHEFGHIFFIEEDTEAMMNRSGVFKFIEEYKATTGGLVNFFLHEDESLRLGVFDELIRRSIGLIAWQRVDDVRAYYCEGLIHLSLLFQSKVLKFADEKISVDFSIEAYERFKKICMKNYENLAKIYDQKVDANEFINKFLDFEDSVYLPLNEAAREFVKFYYAKYELIGNEVDDSGEREKWLNSGE